MNQSTAPNTKCPIQRTSSPNLQESTPSSARPPTHLLQSCFRRLKELGVPVPIVIRMEGTNVDEGKRLLRESGMKLTTADSMDEAAKKVVELAG